MNQISTIDRRSVADAVKDALRGLLMSLPPERKVVINLTLHVNIAQGGGATVVVKN